MIKVHLTFFPGIPVSSELDNSEPAVRMGAKDA